jgi:hypothetical protein
MKLRVIHRFGLSACLSIAGLAIAATSRAQPSNPQSTPQAGSSSTAGGVWFTQVAADPPASSTAPAASAAPSAPSAPPAPKMVVRPPPETVTDDSPVEVDKTSVSESPDDERLLHGFRLGFGYVMNYDQPVASLGGQSLKDAIGMRTPQQFLLGYEFMYRVTGHSWLNVILLANATVAGLEQSKFFPTGNGLIGFEINKSFQVGVGPSLTPLKGQEAHVILAAGWTPRVGRFYVPLHAFYIPDVDGLNRMGVTTGVTF